MTVDGRRLPGDRIRFAFQVLPDEVEPDVTYRDITVRWRARSRIVHPADQGEDN